MTCVGGRLMTAMGGMALFGVSTVEQEDFGLTCLQVK